MNLKAAFLLFSLALSAITLSYAEGRLVIVGGALSNTQDDIFAAFLKSEKDLSAIKIAVIPAASSKPSFYGNAFRDTLIKRGIAAENVRVLPLAVRNDSSTDAIDESTWAANGDAPEVVEWIDQCDLVWFTGGDQSRITAVLKPDNKPTKALHSLNNLLKRGGTIGGTSAGAAMMSETMIVGGSSEGALFTGLAKESGVDQEGGPLLLGEGLGFFKDGIIDQHFDAKARLGRLILATTHADRKVSEYGFGIDENTALVVDLAKRTATVAGSAQVIVISSAELESSKGFVRIKEVRISALGAGDTIDLSTKQITPSGDKSATVGHEYYDIPKPASTGVLSSYGNLNMLLTRLLVDNKASQSVSSYLFSNDQKKGFHLHFSQDEKTKGFWAYRDGQVDHYTVVDALLNIEPIQISIELVGCKTEILPTQNSQGKSGNILSTKEIWTVTADGEFENGEQLLVMEHGIIEGSGEPILVDTYGLKITNNERDIYLLWANSPNNPYGLKKGDRFHFKDTIKQYPFDEVSNGYRVSKQDIVMINQSETGT